MLLEDKNNLEPQIPAQKNIISVGVFTELSTQHPGDVDGNIEHPLPLCDALGNPGDEMAHASVVGARVPQVV